ncbi:unnamed protein product [Rotaria sp. Silwood1]|nr:unnamed protein product [Rotaria sp. Silwood1]
MLVDENTNIHSSEQYDYVSLRDCRKKFNFYLLYSTQPKYVNQTYYVRIDIYNKEKMEYYDTMFYPIRYSFLPVHRLALLVDVPIRDVATVSKKCLLKCLHGQCRYFSNFDKYFCQCLNGYSGMLCTIKNSCDCSPDSIYVGIVNNRSICICPLDKFGPRCYLKRTGCISNLCSNSSRCIANDETYSETEYYCLCSQGYMGSRCENPETKIEFLFAKTISIPQTMFIYFIYIPSISKSYSSPPADPPQIIMVSKLKFYESSSFVYFGGEFHIIFVKIHQHYYLALLRHNSTLGINISTTIIPEHRCLSIKDLFTDNIPILPRWHRAKHYHIPCQKHSNLVCFYDNDFFMCLCDIDRNANCFKFDYRPLYKCFGYNYCENDGQCHIDNSTCPTSSSCFCKECYYGSRCQFTTTGFGLSLDDILGYNIWPNIPFSRQPKVLFKLIGKEAFTIAKHHCTINIDVVSSFVYEYSLDVDGKPLEKFSEKRSKISRMWTLTLYRKNYRIVLEKDTLDLWVNGQRIEADATFEDEGGEIVFDIGRHQANLKAVSSGNPRLEINHVLFVDEVEISQESEYDNN